MKVKQTYKDCISLKEFQSIYLEQGPILLGPGLLSCTFLNVPTTKNLLPLALNGNKYLILVDPKNIFGQELKVLVPANK